MGDLTRFNLPLLKRELGVATLYEIGNGKVAPLSWVHDSGIENISMIVPQADMAYMTIGEEKRSEIVKWITGDCVELIKQIPSRADGPRLFFLDMQFAEGVLSNGHAVGHERILPHRVFPLIDGLAALVKVCTARDWIVIDDARLFVDGVFAKGECPDSIRLWIDRPRLDECLAGFAATHDVLLLRQDHGYFLLVPKQSSTDWRDVVLVLPGDPAGNGVLPFSLDVPGATSISIQRRIADHRFSTRYFVGRGLDVGGGGDTLALFQEFFPMATSISCYDVENGDAQVLRNVASESFDFLYSSHCLEHMRDVREALSNWLRVVRSGGHLVIQVPDEDLYEQGQWPSRYNSDHKFTFTISKVKSWSPVSVNLLDLLKEFSPLAKIISLAQIDQGFRTRMVPAGVDQTRTPLAECGIEFVLKKY